MGNLSSESRLARLQNFEGLMLTDRTYNLVIGLTLTVGVLIDMAMAYYLALPILRMNYLFILIVYFIGSLGCTFVIYRSKNPAVSFAGFVGLSASMGLLLTYFLTAFALADVRTAFTMTAAAVVLMVALATVFPGFFLSIGRGLGIALLVTIVVEVVATLILRRSMGIFDYLVVLIFCGYLGYDWARAQQFPKTLDNAIDSAADIYVDIVNLFIRILSILGRRKD